MDHAQGANSSLVPQQSGVVRMVHGLAMADSKLAGKADIERWKTHWKAYLARI